MHEELDIDKNLENAIRSYSKHIESISDKEMLIITAFLKTHGNNDMARCIIDLVINYIKINVPHMFPGFGDAEADFTKEDSIINMKCNLKYLTDIIDKSIEELIAPKAISSDPSLYNVTPLNAPDNDSPSDCNSPAV